MPIITIVILVHSREEKAKQDKTRQGKKIQEKTREYEIYIVNQIQ